MYNPTLIQSKFISDISTNVKMEAKQFISVKLGLSDKHMQHIKCKCNAMLFKHALVPAKQNKEIITHPHPILLKLKDFL